MSETTGSALSQCDHGVEAWQCRTCVDAEMDYMRDRAELAERERDELHEAIEQHRNDVMAAETGGWLPDERRKGHANERLWQALSADADAEPKRPRCLTCEYTGLYPPGNDDGYGCWDCNQPPRRRDGTCAVCDERRDPDAEPSRAGVMGCGHDSINYSYVLGCCRACDIESAESSDG